MLPCITILVKIPLHISVYMNTETCSFSKMASCCVYFSRTFFSTKQYFFSCHFHGLKILAIFSQVSIIFLKIKILLTYICYKISLLFLCLSILFSSIVEASELLLYSSCMTYCAYNRYRFIYLPPGIRCYTVLHFTFSLNTRVRFPILAQRGPFQLQTFVVWMYHSLFTGS